jgi:hypothetical protein
MIHLAPEARQKVPAGSPAGHPRWGACQGQELRAPPLGYVNNTTALKGREESRKTLNL